ncbi:MAG: EscU/YscU/HrcU family type III secretion system export apparatus switch protein, partial [Clostridia bacterium]|nr:EscU/YscU/HrcU family type III secretion system export apparatus switch protein [Clostridia bacterium]
VREWTPGEVRALGLGAAAAWALAAGPMLAAGVVGAVLAGLGQTGFALAPARVQPRPAALDPVAGFRRLLSLRTLAEMVRSLVKLAVLAVVAASVLRDLPAELPVLPLTAPTEGVRHFAAVLDALVGRAAVAFLALAAADLAYQRWQYERDLRMSRQEVREELKETEGDPAVRGRRRRLQRELARQRMLRDVARAHVVVTNPIHYAVALRYEPLSMEAPVVLARGRGLLARRIREQARRYGVTVVENAALARGLYYATRVGQPIPAAFYQAVAEVLAFVWRLKRYRLPELPVGREMRR